MFCHAPPASRYDTVTLWSLTVTMARSSPCASSSQSSEVGGTSSNSTARPVMVLSRSKWLCPQSLRRPYSSGDTTTTSLLACLPKLPSKNVFHRSNSWPMLGALKNVGVVSTKPLKSSPSALTANRPGRKSTRPRLFRSGLRSNTKRLSFTHRKRRTSASLNEATTLGDMVVRSITAKFTRLSGARYR